MAFGLAYPLGTVTFASNHPASELVPEPVIPQDISVPNSGVGSGTELANAVASVGVIAQTAVVQKAQRLGVGTAAVSAETVAGLLSPLDLTGLTAELSVPQTTSIFVVPQAAAVWKTKLIGTSSSVVSTSAAASALHKGILLTTPSSVVSVTNAATGLAGLFRVPATSVPVASYTQGTTIPSYPPNISVQVFPKPDTGTYFLQSILRICTPNAVTTHDATPLHICSHNGVLYGSSGSRLLSFDGETASGYAITGEIEFDSDRLSNVNELAVNYDGDDGVSVTILYDGVEFGPYDAVMSDRRFKASRSLSAFSRAPQLKIEWSSGVKSMDKITVYTNPHPRRRS